MDNNTLVGIILVIVGLALSPFTCFTTLIITLVGIILIIKGDGSTSKPQYVQQPYYPQQQPQYQQQAPVPAPAQQQYNCATCGAPMRYIQNYQRWYCDHCGKYA